MTRARAESVVRLFISQYNDSNPDDRVELRDRMTRKTGFGWAFGATAPGAEEAAIGGLVLLYDESLDCVVPLDSRRSIARWAEWYEQMLQRPILVRGPDQIDEAIIGAGGPGTYGFLITLRDDTTHQVLAVEPYEGKVELTHPLRGPVPVSSIRTWPLSFLPAGRQIPAQEMLLWWRVATYELKPSSHPSIESVRRVLVSQGEGSFGAAVEHPGSGVPGLSTVCVLLGKFRSFQIKPEEIGGALVEATWLTSQRPAENGSSAEAQPSRLSFYADPTRRLFDVPRKEELPWFADVFET
jgi:hypothetical protein